MQVPLVMGSGCLGVWVAVWWLSGWLVGGWLGVWSVDPCRGRQGVHYPGIPTPTTHLYHPYHPWVPTSCTPPLGTHAATWSSRLRTRQQRLRLTCSASGPICAGLQLTVSGTASLAGSGVGSTQRFNASKTANRRAEKRDLLCFDVTRSQPACFDCFVSK